MSVGETGRKKNKKNNTKIQYERIRTYRHAASRQVLEFIATPRHNNYYCVLNTNVLRRSTYPSYTDSFLNF